MGTTIDKSQPVAEAGGEEYLPVFGEWMRKRRSEKGWTFAKLAEKSGIDSVTLEELQKGRANYLTEGVLAKLAIAFGIADSVIRTMLVDACKANELCRQEIA